MATKVARLFFFTLILLAFVAKSEQRRVEIISLQKPSAEKVEDASHPSHHHESIVSPHYNSEDSDGPRDDSPVTPHDKSPPDHGTPDVPHDDDDDTPDEPDSPAAPHHDDDDDTPDGPDSPPDTPGHDDDSPPDAPDGPHHDDDSPPDAPDGPHHDDDNPPPEFSPPPLPLPHARLTDLIVSSGEKLTPEFDPSVFHYNLTTKKKSVAVEPILDDDELEVLVNNATVKNGTFSQNFDLKNANKVSYLIYLTVYGDSYRSSNYVIEVNRTSKSKHHSVLWWILAIVLILIVVGVAIFLFAAVKKAREQGKRWPWSSPRDYQTIPDQGPPAHGGAVA